MAHPRKSLVTPRLIAFNRQAGRCFYCEQPMWMNNLDEFASSHRLKPSQAMHLKCTGEHLQAHSEGGKADRTNIVAVCAYCNRLRHQRKEPPTPEGYKALVNRRLSQGKWHGLRL
ncbi:HNH endonuclease [Methylomonas koyamae]|uniref:HNH endonuclease n=1 Tax=Methylomonas koyamae TaxID=702114 RepID=UPI002873EA2F|nr:HNH endonuclease [Methylomonas koyamae]WNB74565.1 HNH endonuclease [Methylomonas koyamae]